MKKIFTFFAIALPLLMVSCTKNEVNDNEKGTVTVHFNALSEDDTKAVFGAKGDSGYPVTWSLNDAAPAVTVNYDSEYAQASNFTLLNGGTSASFEAESPTSLSSYTYIAVSPFSALKSVYTAGKRLNVEIPSGQTAGSGTPDEDAVVMYAVSDTFSDVPDDVHFAFNHLSAYMRLLFTNLTLASGETVQSIGISSAKEIAGRMFFYINDDGSIASTGSNSMVSSISVVTDDIDEVWVGIAPVDLSNETVTFSVTTDKEVYTKEITFPDSRRLTSGRVAKFTVDMTGCTSTELVEYQLVTADSQLSVNDEIIIVGSMHDVAMSTAQNGNNRGAAGITKDGTSIWSPGDAVQRITLVDGIVPGEYALYTGSQYLYFDTSGGNLLRSQDSIDDLASWAIAIENSTDETRGTGYVAQIQETTKSRYIRCNNGELFSAYTATSGTSYVRIYKNMSATPAASFNVTNPGLSVLTYKAQTKDIYVFGNVAWTATVDNGASVTASGTGARTLSVSIPENTTSSVKTYTVTVSTTAEVGTQSYSFTLTQAASGAAAVDTQLFYEVWGGNTSNVLNYVVPSAYQSTGSANTVVFGGTPVVYSEYKGGSNTRLYEDGTVYGSTSHEHSNNLMVGMNGGWWKIENIPCSGVKTATLTFNINRGQTTVYTPSSSTDGIRFGTLTSTEHPTDETGLTKVYYTISIDIIFDGSTDFFDLQINNAHTANVRITDIKLVVKELQTE